MVRRASLLVAGASAVFGAVACEPSLNERTFDVSSARVLAVRADPAEVAPGASVTLTALYVDGSGTLSTAPLDWALCEDRNPLANLGPVSPSCAEGSGSGLVELGHAQSEAAALPLDVCRLFGPDVPPTVANQPPGRPVDPDPTGGYYQPVRLWANGQIAIGLVRITCDVPGATPAQIAELTADDHPNANPQIDDVTDPALGPLVVEGSGTNTVAASQRLDLTAHWAACDPAAKSCTGSEGYAHLDPQSHQIVVTREEMRVSWFATGGTFDDDTTGRDPTDATPYTDDGWTAPSTPGTVHVWAVLRDDRGGIGWRSYVIDVR